MTRLLGALVAVVLLAGACSSAPEPDAAVRGDARVEVGSSPTEDRDDAKRSQNEKSAGRAGPKAKSRPGEGAQTGAAGTGSTARQSESRGPTYPAAGRYRYEQLGYEEYCRATCTREDLPPTRTIDISYRNRNARRATLVSDERISSSRSSETRLKVNRAAALITRVDVRFEDEGFRYENTYRPEPPIESLLFPLRVGKSWSGRWDADTSGRYEIDVVGRDGIDVRGRRVNAYRLDTVTFFRGEFDGRGDVSVWVDPETTMVVRSSGRLEIESVFGTFESEFETKLGSGPGY